MTPHARHAATTLADGKVLVCGGSLTGDTPLLDACDVYNPAHATWSDSWPALPVALQGATLTTLDSERVLLAGGIDSVTPVDTARIGTSSGWSDELEPIGQRAEATATLFSNGRVLLIGGYAPAAGGVQAQAVLRVADDTDVPPAERWKPSGELALMHHSVTLLKSGRDALIVGGDNGNGVQRSDVYKYNVDTEQWQPATPLHVARNRHTATLLEDGRVLVVGGQGPGRTILAQAEIYDLAANTWSSAPPSSARAAHVAGRVGPYVIAAGGVGTDGESLDTVELFDPSVGSWRSLAPLSTTRLHAAISETTTPSGEPALLVSGGDGPGASVTADLIAPRLLGRSCSEAADCASNHCADGVCCERDCTGVCEVCAASTGKCAAVDGPPREGHGACPFDLTCDAGACRTSCKSESDCVEGYHCDKGRCSTDLRNGLPCAKDEQCETGVCSGGVCCASRCDGACDTCGSGVCRHVTGAPRAACGSDFDPACPPSCDGESSDCVFPVGTPCSSASCEASTNSAVSAGKCDAAGQCSIERTDCAEYRCDAGECRTECAGNDGCANGYECFSAACKEKSQLGMDCSASAECGSSLWCVDNVCCAEESCPAGSGCGQPPFACRKLLGIECSFGLECQSGNCVDGTCCSDRACLAGSSCANADGICKSPLGEGCSTDGQCSSGHCTEGVCCSTASCEAGSSCRLENYAGNCRTRTGGACTDPTMCTSGHCSKEGRCVECIMDADCGGDARCDREHHCSVPPVSKRSAVGCGLARSSASSQAGAWLVWALAMAAAARARRRPHG